MTAKLLRYHWRRRRRNHLGSFAFPLHLTWTVSDLPKAMQIEFWLSSQPSVTKLREPVASLWNPVVFFMTYHFEYHAYAAVTGLLMHRKGQWGKQVTWINWSHIFPRCGFSGLKISTRLFLLFFFLFLVRCLSSSSPLSRRPQTFPSPYYCSPLQAVTGVCAHCLMASNLTPGNCTPELWHCFTLLQVNMIKVCHIGPQDMWAHAHRDCFTSENRKDKSQITVVS